MCYRRPRGLIAIVILIFQNVSKQNGADAVAGKIYAGRDFLQLLQSGAPFVDKSLLIKDIMEDPVKNILITRPKQFGKSINLSMLKYFLKTDFSSEYLFKNLLISQNKEFCKRHQNKHPTVHLSFHSMAGKSYEESRKHLSTIVNNVYLEHIYLGTSLSLSDQEKKDFAAAYTGSVPSSKVPFLISQLLRMMEKHHKQKVIVLLEGYDTPMTIAYSGKFQQDIIRFLRQLIEDIFNCDAVEKGIIIGMFTEGKNLFSGLKNTGVYTICHQKYSEYFGFLESDIKKLLPHFVIGTLNIVDKLNDYYLGYSIGGNLLFNPLAIILCLESSGTIGDFWLQGSESTVFLDTILMESGGVLPALKADMALRGVEIFTVFEPDTSTDMILHEDTFWTYLLQFGFFTISRQETRKDGKINCYIRIPNKELRAGIKEAIKDYHTQYEVPRYQEFLDSVRLNDTKKVQKIFDQYIKESALFFIEDARLERIATLLKGLETIYGPSRVIADEGDFHLTEMRSTNGLYGPFSVLLIKSEKIAEQQPLEALIENSADKIRQHFSKKDLQYVVIFVHFPNKMDFLDSKTYKQYVKRNPTNDSYTSVNSTKGA